MAWVIVIPNEGWAHDFSEFDSVDIIDYILEKLVSSKKKDGHGHAHPSIWYGNDKNPTVCFLVTFVIYHLLRDALLNMLKLNLLPCRPGWYCRLVGRLSCLIMHFLTNIWPGHRLVSLVKVKVTHCQRFVILQILLTNMKNQDWVYCTPIPPHITQWYNKCFLLYLEWVSHGVFIYMIYSPIDKIVIKNSMHLLAWVKPVKVHITRAFKPFCSYLAGINITEAPKVSLHIC